jgi:LysM repeat protein
MKLVKISFLLLVSIVTSVSNAQNGGKMITHIIKPGETISSLSRIYHVKKDDIFKLNNLNDRTVLHIGQKIVVPMSKSATAVAESAPVNNDKNQVQNFDKNKHLVVVGDNLSRIAKRYHVSEKQIKDWNGLKNDIIKTGSYLIVSNTDVTEKQSVVKAEIKPVEKEVKPINVDVKPVVVEPVKKVESVETPPPTTKPTVTEKPIAKELKAQPATIKTANPTNDFFEKQFVSTQNSIEGLTGTFKTIAGWQDKKYYVLLNNVQSGSVVKVTANNKSVYAKVLGPLPNIKEDNNLALRVSNATAAALGVTENKFTAKIEF